ncbi:MAG: hypothetical protein FWC32_04420 [Firmicutes bacterium]|nr:hypothetical protein [Bacillota bacterium]
MFSYRGITSKLNFITETRQNFPIIIDFLFCKYGVDQLKCQIVLTQGNPEYLFDTIKLSSINGDLKFYQQLAFQFAHELTHAIQQHQKRDLPIEIIKTTNGNYEQTPYPNHSPQETEAVANSVWIIERVLRYSNYNARKRENPTYYDYDKAFALVDDSDIEKMWMKYNKHHVGQYHCL